MSDRPHTRRALRLDTQLIHGAEIRPRIHGAATLPIFQSTVFETSATVDHGRILYPRLATLPNQQVVADKIALLEGAEAGLVMASGMAAISTTLLALLAPGDHLLLQRGVYGGTYTFAMVELARLGIRFDFIEPDDVRSWDALVRPETRAIFVEAISNPLTFVIDHEAVLAFAARHRLLSLIDNTVASPVNFQASRFGYDVVVHSASKYLNGHSDLVAGAVLAKADLMDQIRRLTVHLGGALDPHGCFLLHRGLRTLGLRVRHQNESAQRLAAFLAAHPRVRRVYHPSLDPQASSPGRRVLDGGGGLLSFEPHGDADEADRIMQRLELPVVGPSLGGVESLVTRPRVTSHSGMSADARRQAGIADELIRVSVGLEDPADLIADFEQALA